MDFFPPLLIQNMPVKDSGGMGREEAAERGSEGRVEAVLRCAGNRCADRQLLGSAAAQYALPARANAGAVLTNASSVRDS